MPKKRRYSRPLEGSEKLKRQVIKYGPVVAKGLYSQAKNLAQAYRHSQERKLLSAQHELERLKSQRALKNKQRELKKEIKEVKKEVAQAKTFKKLGIEQY